MKTYLKVPFGFMLMPEEMIGLKGFTTYREDEAVVKDWLKAEAKKAEAKKAEATKKG
ncbi:MAG: hypothetical protein GX466_09445 [Candidatus Cloacimonetes bacterium]|nr:hypothetical protein [Candidatus Cloacimonadota bacterium]